MFFLTLSENFVSLSLTTEKTNTIKIEQQFN